jgi:protein-tyrosine phosphatase
VIDLHCHVVPGIDDGPATMDEAVALARRQAELGVTTIVATPHVGYDWPDNDAARIAAGVAETNAALAAAGVAVEVVAGAEVALSRAVDLDDAELAALRLGGGPWLLLEPPHGPSAAGVEQAIVSLAHRGHRLVIAHPERCPAMLADPPMVERLVAGGALCSVTASALTGRFGRPGARMARDLVARGLAHDVSSDAHGVGPRRPPGMREHVEQAGFGTLADWLCRDVPAAIVAGGPVPARPPVAPPARGLARLLRRA